MSSAPSIAANRFGLGARPGDLERIASGPRAWLLEQLRGAGPVPGSPGPGSAEILVEVEALRVEQRRRLATGPSRKAPAEPVAKPYQRALREHYLGQAHARYLEAVATERPFVERLVHFWANHFAVSADKPPLPALAGPFEHEAIRPHVLGNFADMLVAVEQHPAMLLYLDNVRSVGPDSPVATGARRRGSRSLSGLNENLAREILELHTLGVDGGYGQEDVVALAAVISGWSLGGALFGGRLREGEPGTFEFRENMHEPGRRTVLGRTYDDAGAAQGVAVLRDLALHPSTARHLARKLAVHFVADEPPERLVQRLADTYLEHDGALLPVYRELVEAEAPWAAFGSKLKTPHEFVVSTFRAFGHEPRERRFPLAALELLGQLPWRPGSPAGWPDTAGDWGGADALYKRIEWSGRVARTVGERIEPLRLGAAVLGPALTAATRAVISGAESREQGLALLLASPDFQRR